MPRKPRSTKRDVGTRSNLPKVFIFCEGANTEPHYIVEFQRYYRASSVEIVLSRAAGVPTTLFEKASEKRALIGKRGYTKKNGDKDQVWVVFDRDDHPKVDQVIAQCRAKDIGFAFSDPCFEVWLILHVEAYSVSEHRHDVQRKCEDLCEGYSRAGGKRPNYAVLIQEAGVAKERAVVMNARTLEVGGADPYTNFYDLLDSIESGEKVEQ